MTAAPQANPRFSAASVGVIAGLAATLVNASTGPVIKPLLEGGWSLGAALLLRMVGAALVLSPWLVCAMVRNPRFLRRHWLLITGFGLTGVAGAQLAYFSALERMPVGVALLIMNLAPVLLVGWVWIWTRRSPSRVVLTGTVAAVTGLVLAVDITGAEFDLLGILFALCAAGCLAAYFVVAERTGDSLPPLALAAGGFITGGILTGALCVAGMLPFVAPLVTVHYGNYAVPWFAGIAWVSLVTTAAGYGLSVISASLIGARLASFIGLAEVLFAVALAWMLLSEVPTVIQAVGGALILAGVILVRADPSMPGVTGGISVPLDDTEQQTGNPELIHRKPGQIK